MDIGDGKYISLTTFTRDGRAKPTPVWIADLGNSKVGFTTQESSWKAKRIRSDPEVLLQPCDVRGRVKAGTEPMEATAEVVSGADYEAVRDKVADKYGWQYSMIGLRARMKKLVGKEVPPDCGIVITPKN